MSGGPIVEDTVVPVVLVHGTNGRSTRDWGSLRPALEQEGHVVAPFDWRRRPRPADGRALTPLHARELHDHLVEVARSTGCREVDVVAHSWGAVIVEHQVRGLVDGPPVDAADAPRVRSLVGLAPTYAGTTASGLARHHRMLPGRARVWLDDKLPTWSEQLAGSAVLRDLYAAPAPTLRRTTIVTRRDRVVTPWAASTELGLGGDLVVVQDRDPAARVGHVGLPHHPVAIDVVLAALSSRDAGQPGAGHRCGGRAS